ncbi:hypothetical protein AB0O91_00180 [Kitasatospora sp. NPDC089797]
MADRVCPRQRTDAGGHLALAALAAAVNPCAARVKFSRRRHLT